MAAIADIMTPEPYTVEPETSIREVAEAMVKRRFGSVVVTTGSMILGIFTERDVLRATAAGADPREVAVKEWMTKNPVTVPPETDTGQAAETMLTQGFRHLPVTEGNELVGIVSLRDLLSARIGR